MILTVIHHIYGTAIYAPPRRHHVAFIMLPVLLMLVLAYSIIRRSQTTLLGKISMWGFVALALLFPAGLIGL